MNSMDTTGPWILIHSKGSEPFPGTGLYKRARVVADITIPSSSGVQARTERTTAQEPEGENQVDRKSQGRHHPTPEQCDSERRRVRGVDT